MLRCLWDGPEALVLLVEKTLHVLQSAAVTVAHCQKYTRKLTAHFKYLDI